MSRRGSRASAAESDLIGELRRLYAEVDAVYAEWSCPTSSECCRFGITGREPFVTSIEVAAIEQAVARRGGPLAPRRRSLPLLDDGREERPCPLLDRDGRCSIYADRPLGCRTFYCGRATQGAEVPRPVLHDVVNRLRELAARHRPEGDKPRPLGRVLKR